MDCIGSAISFSMEVSSANNSISLLFCQECHQYKWERAASLEWSPGEHQLWCKVMCFFNHRLCISAFFRVSNWSTKLVKDQWSISFVLCKQSLRGKPSRKQSWHLMIQNRCPVPFRRLHIYCDLYIILGLLYSLRFYMQHSAIWLDCFINNIHIVP